MTTTNGPAGTAAVNGTAGGTADGALAHGTANAAGTEDTADAENPAGGAGTGPAVCGTTTTMARALGAALRDAMAEDERVVVLGEDVGRLGGVFRVTDGLAKEFGAERCLDTPVSESGIAGLAVGMAMAGFRPVVEMQFDAFAYPAFEQIASHVAKMRNRTRGTLPLPLVIRVPYGGGIGGVEHHSDSSEAYWAHTAGLKVVAPGTVADAYALLRLAIEDPDPVVFLEPKRQYWSRGEAGPSVPAQPLGRAEVRRAGADATLVAYGPSVPVALAAAGEAAADGWDIEVVDLRTLVPLDDHTLTESVRRTGRCLVVHEAQGFAGVGAEIAARVQERCFEALAAPVLRVTGFDIPYPPPLLEDAHLPGTGRVLAGLRRLLRGEPPRRESHGAAPALRSGDGHGERTFQLPDLGEGLTEAEVLEWRVAVGDTVETDQCVAEVETAKSVMELPSPFRGTVTALHCAVGETVATGAPLLSVREVGAPVTGPAQGAPSGAVLTGYGVRPGRALPSPGPRGGGRPGGNGASPLEWEAVRVPLDAAAEKFVRARREAPAVTIWADADATGLLAATDSLGIGVLPLLARICLDGLREHPALNSRVDTDRQEVVRLPHVHLAVPVQTADGLVVPVLRDADALPPPVLAGELGRLVRLARDGALPGERRTGGTFTLNNYGVFGVDGATPILNHPQTAMLGVGRITDRPMAVAGRAEVRKAVQLSLTFDHRVCDGGTAAGFLRYVAENVTSPRFGA